MIGQTNIKHQPLNIEHQEQTSDRRQHQAANNRHQTSDAFNRHQYQTSDTSNIRHIKRQTHQTSDTSNIEKEVRDMRRIHPKLPSKRFENSIDSHLSSSSCESLPPESDG
jgi:hypothetical protein